MGSTSMEPSSRRSLGFWRPLHLHLLRSNAMILRDGLTTEDHRGLRTLQVIRCIVGRCSGMYRKEAKGLELCSHVDSE